MKYNLVSVVFGFIILTTVVAILTAGFLMKPAKGVVKPSSKGFAVVELFTSEGCSSCPPADAEVENISVLHPDKVYVVGFHVDYWNRLGWKDEFSDSAYSGRQQGYAATFNLNGVYTPQVVINGKRQLVGSDAPGIERSVDTEIKNTSNRPIELSASGSGGKTVQVTYRLETVPLYTVVNIALIQMAAQTNVKRGENKGKTLRHINIVRDFKTISLSGQTVNASLTLPDGVIANECKVIVYLQQLKTREISAVAEASIE